MGPFLMLIPVFPVFISTGISAILRVIKINLLRFAFLQFKELLKFVILLIIGFFTP